VPPPCHTDGMPSWVPAAAGLVVFWALVLFVLRLVFRRPNAAAQSGVLDPEPEAEPDEAPEPLSGHQAPSGGGKRPESEPRGERQPAPEPAPPEGAPLRRRDPVPPLVVTDPPDVAALLPFAVRHRRLVAASRRLAEKQQR
jgi:hypothetical protein